MKAGPWGCCFSPAFHEGTLVPFEGTADAALLSIAAGSVPADTAALPVLLLDPRIAAGLDAAVTGCLGRSFLTVGLLPNPPTDPSLV